MAPGRRILAGHNFFGVPAQCPDIKNGALRVGGALRYHDRPGVVEPVWFYRIIRYGKLSFYIRP